MGSVEVVGGVAQLVEGDRVHADALVQAKLILLNPEAYRMKCGWPGDNCDVTFRAGWPKRCRVILATN